MDSLNTGWSKAQDQLDKLGYWALAHPDQVFTMVIVASAVLFMLWLYQRQNVRPSKGEAEEMAKRERQLDILYADCFGDSLFELYHTGVISRQEYKRASRRFGLKYQLSDLLPRRNHQRAIAARVRKNVELMHKSLLKVPVGRTGGYVLKPGEAPPAPPPVKTRKVFLVVGKSLRK